MPMTTAADTRPVLNSGGDHQPTDARDATPVSS